MTGNGTEESKSGMEVAIAAQSHQLRCIFNFLGIDEVATRAIPCCKQWRDAAMSLTPRSLERQLSLAQLAALLRASIRGQVNGVESADDGKLSFSTLQFIRVNMPHLTNLKCTLNPTIDAPFAIGCFGAQLQRLQLHFAFPSADPIDSAARWQQIGAVISAAAECSPLEELRLFSLPSIDPPLDLLQPLTRTASIGAIQLHAGENAVIPWQQSHIDVIRSLPQLTEVNLGDCSWSAEQMQWLTTDPPPSRLQSVGFIPAVGAAHAASLSRLSNLTSLATRCLNLEDASFIGSLRRLQFVAVGCEAQVDPQRLMGALAQCSELTSLSLSHPQLSNSQLVTLLPHLPRLMGLCLVNCPDLHSLTCLSATPHLATSLRCLQLVGCRSLPSAELLHVQQLDALADLLLSGSFPAPLDPFILASFAPDRPNANRRLNPNLRNFQYVAP